jgi:hypothetical protein
MNAEEDNLSPISLLLGFRDRHVHCATQRMLAARPMIDLSGRGDTLIAGERWSCWLGTGRQADGFPGWPATTLWESLGGPPAQGGRPGVAETGPRAPYEAGGAFGSRSRHEPYGHPEVLGWPVDVMVVSRDHGHLPPSRPHVGANRATLVQTMSVPRRSRYERAATPQGLQKLTERPVEF